MALTASLGVLVKVAYPESVPLEGDVVALAEGPSKEFEVEGVRVFSVRRDSHAIKSVGAVHRRY